MPELAVKYVRCINSVNMRVASLLQYGVFALVGVLLFEGFSRYFFNAPRVWSIELATFIMGTYFLVAGGYTLLREAHVRMDVLYSKWTPKRRAILDLVTFPLVGIYLSVCIFGGIRNIEYSLRVNQHSITMWSPPLAPIKVIITVACVLLFAQVISFVIRDIAILRGRPIT